MKNIKNGPIYNLFLYSIFFIEITGFCIFAAENGTNFNLTKLQNNFFQNLKDIENLQNLPLEMIMLISSLTLDYDDQLTQEAFNIINDHQSTNKVQRLNNLIQNGLNINAEILKNNGDKQNLLNRAIFSRIGFPDAEPMATEKEYYDIITLLLENRANPNSTFTNKMTSLILAATSHQLDVIQLLLEFDADPTFGETGGKNFFNLLERDTDLKKVYYQFLARKDIVEKLKEIDQFTNFSSKLLKIIASYHDTKEVE